MEAILIGLIDGDYRYDVRHVERLAIELRLAGVDPVRATARQIAGTLNRLNHLSRYSVCAPREIRVRYQGCFPPEAESTRTRAALERRADDIASRLDWPNGAIAQIPYHEEPATFSQRLSALRVRLRYARMRLWRLLGWTS
jgi:hypothetical protein